MGINISPKTNYSALFSSLPTNKNSVSSSFSLSDYSTIKNGSYYKLMKAYYGKDASKEVQSLANKGASADTAPVNSKLQSSSDALKKSTDALLKTGEGSVFAMKEMTTKDENGVESKKMAYDMDAIGKAVETFAKDYNSMLDAAKNSRNASALSSAANMVTQTARMENILSKVGVSVGDDNKLSVNMDALKKADVNTLKSVFNGAGSFAYNVQSKASYVAMYAKEDATKASGTYSQAATYSSNVDNGYNFNSFF